jgi:hypothetical protein
MLQPGGHVLTTAFDDAAIGRLPVAMTDFF